MFFWGIVDLQLTFCLSYDPKQGLLCRVSSYGIGRAVSIGGRDVPDPTAATTHLSTSSAVQCVVSHWGLPAGIELVSAYAPRSGKRYRSTNAPIIEFHGNADSVRHRRRSGMSARQ